MNTNQALENLNDANIFHKLAWSILGLANSEYYSLNNPGLNERDQSIKSPLDSCGWTNNKYVCVEYTITENKGKRLESKWLNSKETATKPLGDLIKQINEIQKLKLKFPKAKYKAILCSNQKIAKDIEEKAKVIALNSDIEVEIWWQDNFVSYLDNFPTGQYFREKYLGIESEQLSKELFVDICKKNLKNYKQYSNIGIQNLVYRDELKEFQNILVNDSEIIFLQSPPGKGKSILCFQLLEQSLLQGGFGLWINSEYIEKYSELNSIEQIIDKMLHDEKNNLAINQIENIQQYCRMQPLIIIIDDINKSKDSAKIIEWLLKRTQEDKKTDKNGNTSKYYKIICPVWAQNVTNVENKRIFRIQEYSDNNAFDAIKNILGNKFSKVDIWKLASILKNDPYLISLLNEVPKNQNIENIFEIAHNICDFYINKMIKEIASRTNYLAEEIEEQLDILLYNMLLNKNLFPTFSELQKFEKVNIDILRAIFKTTKICSLSNKKLLFSHDRIKEYLLGKAIINKYSQVNNIDESILAEPYYIDIIARSLSEIKINSTSLNILLNENPIAIFASVKYINDFENYYLRDEILQIFKNHYLTHNEIYYDEIAKCLYDINTKEFVKNIDNNFSKELKKKNYNSWNLLSFKFGYLSNGIVYYYSRYNSWGIAYDNNFISNIFYLKQKYSNISITKSFDTMFEKINPKLLDSAFLAAGFFELKDINRQVENYWIKTTHKEESLPYLIFALLKCFNDKTPAILDKLMHFLKGLSEDSKSGLSDKGNIITLLRLGMKPHLNSKAIKYLIGYATENPDEACVIYTILDDIDDKFVFEFKCNYYVKHPRMLDLGDHNWNLNNQRQIKKISTESLLHLKKLWLDKNNDNQLRYKALKFYHTYATKEDLSDLRELSNAKKADNNLRNMSIITRARLSDLSVFKDLLQLAKKQPHYWHEFQNIWTEKCIDILNQELKQKDKEWRNHFIFDLLQRIPKNNATDIIKINWNKFNKNPDFLAAAFQVGTDITVDLLIGRLTASRKPVSIRFFGCSYQSDKISIKLNSNSFEKISPYYNKVDKESLSSLLLDLDRPDKELSKNALKELFINLDNEEKAKNCYFKYLPRTENDIINDLDVLRNKEEPIYFYRDFISNNKEKILKILPIWSENNKNYESFKLYAEILKLVGSRQDISNFENFKNYFIDTPQEEKVSITYTTTIFTIMRKSLL